MSTYKGATPSTKMDPRIVEFYEQFYAISDKPTDHEIYANALTKDGTLIMGAKKVEGYDQILEFRKSLWSGPVKKRKHTLEKIFPFGENSNEVMLYGKVDYVLKNDKDVTVDWAGHALLVEDGGSLKMKFYQVYLDSGVVANAMK